MSRFYVTTPIYYVNDVPHLGTAYTTIVCDALRRYHLLRGDDTYMLTGTDEHGLKIEREAQERGVSPQAFVDSISERFREAWPKLGVEADQFIRTTDADHKAFVQELWQTIEKNGDLYEGTYEDWYCVGCESYKTEKELLPGNLCPLHQKPVERVKESTFFFRLSKYEKPLLELYAREPRFVLPESRMNEVKSFVEGGLRDLSVSRTSFQWGIPVPNHAPHIMYVWFDALTNYMSALGKGDKTRFWKPGREEVGHPTRLVHIVGKDILRFHTVYWPAFLMSAGLPLPDSVFAHGFLTVDGQKMSKTLRNAVDPLRLAAELGTDVIRYYLLRAVSFGQDGDFDHKGLIERYNADLGKNLGNLLQRTLGLCAKASWTERPARGTLTSLETDLDAAVSAELASVKKHWDALEPHLALEATWRISSLANTYVDRSAPWALLKEQNLPRLETVLSTLLEVLRVLSVLVWPAMPEKSTAMRKQLGLEALAPKRGEDMVPAQMLALPPQGKLGASGPLFPVFDKEQEAALLARLMPPKAEPNVSVDQAEPVAPAAPAVPAEAMAPVTFEQFAATDLRVGVVKSAEKVPKKDKLLKLMVDVGEPEPRQIVAGLALSFKPEDLVDKRVIVVANLAPRDFGKGLVSHGMLLAAGPSEALTMATVPGEAAPGTKIK